MQIDGVLGVVIAVAALCSLVANAVWMGRFLYRRALVRNASAVGLVNDAAFLQAIFDFAPYGTIVLDAADGNRIVAANREWYRENLLDESKVTGATALETDIWLNPKDRERLLAPLGAASSTSMIDAPVRCGDGGVSWYRFAARRILLGGRNLIICSGHNVDVQRETEYALRASNALFSQIFDLVPEGLVLTDAGHRYQNVNRAWLARTGYSREQVIGRTSNELNLWPNPVDPLLLRETLARDGQVEGIRVHARMADGRTTLSEIFGRRFESNGEMIGIWLSRDITEREEISRRLQQKQQQLEQILSMLPEPVIVTDSMTGQVLEVNPAWEKLLGRSRHDAVGRTSLEMGLYFDADAQRARDELRKPLQNGEVIDAYEIRLRHADGHAILAEVSARTVLQEGQSLYVYTVRDVTQSRRMFKELQESKDVLAQIFDIVPEAIAITEKSTGHVLRVNRFWEEKLGYMQSVVFGKTANELKVWVDMAAVSAMGQRFAMQGKLDAEPQDIRRFDGSIVHMEVSARQMELQAQQTTLWVFRDISEQRMAKQALEHANATLEQRVLQRTLDLSQALTLVQHTKDELLQSERRLSGVMAATGEGIWDINLEAGRFYCNARWCQILAFDASHQELDTAFVQTLVHEDDACAVASRFRDCIIKGVPYRSEHRMRRQDGTVIWVADRGDVFERSPSGRTVRLVGSTADITDRKLAELSLAQAKERAESVSAELHTALLDLRHAQERLVQSEKMGSMEALLIGVAHELNTPLGNALTTASNLQHQVDEFSQLLHSASVRRSQLDAFVAHCKLASDLMERNTARAAKLVSTFKQLAVDRNSLPRSQFGLAGAVDESVREVAQSVVQRHVHIRQLIASGIVLDSYREALTQVLTNLLQNSVVHAMCGDQALTIKLQADLGVLHDRPAVKLVVSDDGAGMEPEVAKRAFDPYFTTRLGQGGSGLGLYQVYNLVHSALGGTLTLDSSLGHGTRITMILPLSAPAATPDVPWASAAPP